MLCSLPLKCLKQQITTLSRESLHIRLKLQNNSKPKRALKLLKHQNNLIEHSAKMREKLESRSRRIKETEFLKRKQRFMMILMSKDILMKVNLLQVTVIQSLRKRSRWRKERVMTIGMSNALSAKKTEMSCAVRHAQRSVILNAQDLNINQGVIGSVNNALLINADDLE